MRISDWSSDVCSSDLAASGAGRIEHGRLCLGDGLRRAAPAGAVPDGARRALSVARLGRRAAGHSQALHRRSRLARPHRATGAGATLRTRTQRRTAYPRLGSHAQRSAADARPAARPVAGRRALRVNVDGALARAYADAQYVIEIPDGPLTRRIGHIDANADARLRAHGRRRHWSIVTPCNPRSQAQRDTYNEARLRAMRQQPIGRAP